MCAAKNTGGMGLRSLREFNIALLGKQGWRLLTEPNCLLAWIFQARYYPGANFLGAQIGHNPSFAWRNILAAQEVIWNGCRWRIGDGRTVSVWKDPWLPNDVNPFVETTVPEGMEEMKVADLLVPNDSSWDYELLHELFSERDRDLITKIPIYNRRPHDLWSWTRDKNGVHSVRGGYRSQMEQRVDMLPNPAASIWSKIWKLKVPPKVLNLLWRTGSDCLPTRAALVQRRVPINDLCPICGGSSETTLHALVDCPRAVDVWIRSAAGFVRGSVSSFLEWLELAFNRLSVNECCYGVLEFVEKS